MLRPRIIPCLLVHKKGLVKTISFSDPKYVGDPINAVKIFNEKNADELIVIDIDATVNGVEPDYKMVADLAAECRMPLCYGGGIRSAAQAKRIIGLGVEKIALSSAAIESPTLLSNITEALGRQSVVLVLDVRRQAAGSKYDVFVHNGTINTGRELLEMTTIAEKCGVGEIVVNSIENDGKMSGYDLNLAKIICEAVNTPVTILGGAGSMDDIAALIRTCGIVGASAGSMFVFKGAYRAVLINYPTLVMRDELIRTNLI